MASDVWARGWPLFGAALQYAAAEKIEEFRRIGTRSALSGRRLYPNPSISDPETVARAHERNRQADRADAAYRRLCRDLIEKLQSGEVVSAGIAAPAVPTSEYEPIAAHLWQVLKPNFKASSARGAGLIFEGIRVLHPDEIASWESREGTIVRADPYKSGAAGRPSIAHLLKAEFSRRAEVGEVAETLKAEAASLHEWAKATHTEAPTPTARTIENMIRADFRAYSHPTK